MIPISKPYFDQAEIDAVQEVIRSGWVSQGPKVAEFEKAFAAYTGASFACAVSNCTAALHLALLTVGVKPDDFVITVSHSFIATSNAIRHCQANPIFIDICPDTYNIDVEKLRNFLSKRTKKRRISALLIVHQMGMPANLKKVIQLAKEYDLPVVEDAACAIGSEVSLDEGISWDKIGLPHGDIACFSFHPRKVLCTGEGGMLTTNHEAYDRQFRLLRQHGMSISDRIRHEAKTVLIENYLCVGFNYRMTDIQAAIGIEQLKKMPQFLKRRHQIARRYHELLKDVPWVKLPQEPSYARTNWQSFPVRILEEAPLSRNEFMQNLLDQGISSRLGIMNAHEEIPYQESGLHLEESEKARRMVLCLPIFFEMNNEDLEAVVIHLSDQILRKI